MSVVGRGVEQGRPVEQGPSGPRGETRAEIIDVAARLMREHGAGAVTTRAVAAAAGVQGPTIYRIFGDKGGLLDAVVERVMAEHVTTKALSVGDGDPVADLRAGWDAHLGFGLAHPALFALLADPERRQPSPALAAGLEVLRARVRRVALAGRLRVGERRAVALLHAAGTGAVLTTHTTPEADRDPDLVAATFDAVARVILTDDGGAPDAPTAGAGAERGSLDEAAAVAVVTLRAAVPDLPGLSDAERALLAEWLERIGALGGQAPV